jgi:L-seryl-tRNA(Ser) seleniumtransferase
MTHRRDFIKGVAAVLPASIILPSMTDVAAGEPAAPERDYYKEIGVRPFVNAAAAYTALGGRYVWPEVVAAMEYARDRNVIMDDLHDVVGKRIAQLAGCEAALVTAGASSAMTLGTAACITGTNEEFIRRIPDLRGMKDEVIVQKAHRYAYDHAVRNCGIRFLEVETASELERAVNPRTAMMFFCYLYDEKGRIRAQEFAALAKKSGVPTLVDGSNTIPPAERLSLYNKIGFDLAAFSGGKGIRGPASAGLLVGRKDLIQAARMNNSPSSDTIGRGMKVSKEEVLGMMAAVEVCLKYDYSGEAKREMRLVRLIAEQVATIPGFSTKIVYPPTEAGRPHLQLYWDKVRHRLTVEEAKAALKTGVTSFFATPRRYSPSVINGDSPSRHFAEPVRSQLHDKVTRVSGGKDGTCTYDVAGTPAFTNLFAVEDGAPDPAGVSVASGLVTCGLVAKSPPVSEGNLIRSRSSSQPPRHQRTRGSIFTRSGCV